jgi:CYTH domain-containing protein
VHTVHDEHEGHEARIAAKRTRYLLEPVAKIVPGAAGIVERLKALQDVLGDLHDAQVFGAEIAALAAEQAADEPTEKRPNKAARRSANRSATTAPNAVPMTGTPAVPAGAQTPAPAPSAVPVATGTTAAAPPLSTGIPPADSASAVAATAVTPPAATQLAMASPAPLPDIAPGIAAIRERLSDRATAAFSRFSTEWLGDNSASFFRDLDAVVGRIADAASDGLEIERKYLLRFVPDEARDGRRIDIAQGYVPGSRLHERIRRVSVAHGSGRKEIHFYRTVKVGEGVVRTEIEEETTESIFLAMWPLTKRRRLRKRRFEVEADGRTWEIDEFKNRDLVLAEIELDSEDDDVVFPDWLAPAVQREVTGEPEFQNINLAR